MEFGDHGGSLHNLALYIGGKLYRKKLALKNWWRTNEYLKKLID